MSFIAPVFKIHSLVQETLSLPVYFNTSTTRVTPNPVYNQRRHKIVRYLSWIALISTIILNGHRIAWLFFNWVSYTRQNIDEGVMYMLAFLAQTIGFTCLFVFANHSVDFFYCVNECIKLESKPAPNQLRLPFLGRVDAKALFSYTFSIPFLLFPISFAAIPLVITFDPIQLYLGTSLFAKLFAGVVYGFGMLYVAWVALSIFTSLFLILDSILTLSSKLLVDAVSSHFQLGHVNLYQEELTKNGCKWISRDFNKSFKRYLKVVLLTRTLSNVISTFLTRLALVGIVLVSFATFATLKLRPYMNIIIYLSTPAGTVVGFILIISITHMADVPYQNSLEFQAFWKRRLYRTADRKRLLTCGPVGLTLGPYEMVTASLGLRMCDDVFNNTATLLLMGII